MPPTEPGALLEVVSRTRRIADLEPEFVTRALERTAQAGHSYAVIPDELAAVMVETFELVGYCLEEERDAAALVGYVCLRPEGHHGDHGWPGDYGQRRALAKALRDQTDPVARIERRWREAQGLSTYGDPPPR